MRGEHVREGVVAMSRNRIFRLGIALLAFSALSGCLETTIEKQLSKNQYELVPLLGARTPAKDNRVFGVEVDFTSGKHVLVWDTGTRKTLISSRLARELAVEIKPPVNTNWKDAKGVPILVGDAAVSFVLFNETYSDYPVSVFREEVFPTIDGFIGTDIALRSAWTMDAESGIITVGEAGIQEEELARVPLVIDEGRIFIDCKINGKKRTLFFDTGLSDVVLTQASAEGLGLQFGKEGFETLNLGKKRHAKADIELGGIAFEKSDVYVLEQQLREFPMLGQNVLNQMVYTVNPEQRVLIVHRRRE